MSRRSIACSVVVLTLAACEREDFRGNLQAVAPARDTIPEAVLITGSLIRATAKLAYSHDIAIEMADDRVAPRFERGRTACLEDPTLNCNLLEASITVGNANAGVRANARLSVRLPHASVQRFQTLLLEPLPGEGSNEPSLRRSSTTAEDLTLEMADLDRRLAQETDYRDRLTVLSRRTDAKVDDLIKVQQNLSEVQSSIEGMAAQSRDMTRRIDTELLNISLSAYEPLTNASSPLGQAWRESARALGESTASAFLFVVVLLPWLPLLALGGLALVSLWRFIRMVRRRKGAVAGA